MVNIDRFASQFENVSDLDDCEIWLRTRGREWGVEWATKHLHQERAALRRLHEFRNWYDSHHDFVWQLEVAANTEIGNRGIPDHLYEDMYGKFPRRSTRSTMWDDICFRGTWIGGYDYFHHLHFAAGFVEGAAAVWEQHMAEVRAEKEEQLRLKLVSIWRGNTPAKQPG